MAIADDSNWKWQKFERQSCYHRYSNKKSIEYCVLGLFERMILLNIYVQIVPRTIVPYPLN